MGTVFTVASAKGGVGKTATTATLGTTLAMAGHDVVVVDGDIGMANLATVLGVDPDGETLHSVLSGDAAVEDAIYEGPEGLSVVPGSTAIEDFREAEATSLRAVLDDLSEFDYVLVDTGAGMSHDSALPLGLADEVVLVSSPEPPALIDTAKTKELAERLDADVAGIVLTRVTENIPFEVPTEVDLDVPVLARVPYDEAVVASFAARRPLCTAAPGSDAAAAYRGLAERLTGEAIPDPTAPADSSGDDAGDEADADASGGTEPVADDETDPAAGADADPEPTPESDPTAEETPVSDASPADASPSADLHVELPGESEVSTDGVANALERAETESDAEASAESDAKGSAESDAGTDADVATLVEEAEPDDDADPDESEYPTVLAQDPDVSDEEEERSRRENEGEGNGGFFSRFLNR